MKEQRTKILLIEEGEGTSQLIALLQQWISSDQLVMRRGRVDALGAVLGDPQEVVITQSLDSSTRVKELAPQQSVVAVLECKEMKAGHELVEFAVPLIGINTHFLFWAIKSVEKRWLARRANKSAAATQLKASHFDSLRLLAGGVAHEFNNLLTGVLGNASLLLYEEDLTEDDREAVQDIEDATRQAIVLAKQLLSFVGRSANQAATLFDVGDRLHELLPLLKSTARQTPRIEVEDSQALPVKFSPVAFVQLVLDLLAAVAFEGKGQVLVQARRVDAEASRGPQVSLSASSSGAPFRDSELAEARRAEPASSRRLRGLANLLREAQQHPVRVEPLDSPQRMGLEIFFPLETGARQHSSGGYRARVLLVEPDKAVRRVVRLMLLKLKTEVIEAANLDEGLDIFEREHEELTLSIFDVDLFDEDPSPLYCTLQRLSPGATIVFTTGLGEQTLRQHLPQVECLVIEKPFRLETLAQTLEGALVQIDHKRDSPAQT